MGRSTVLRLAAAALALVLAACGGDGATGPATDDAGGDFFLRARIDGVPWTANAGSTTGGVPLTLPGAYAIVGGEIGAGRTLVLSLYNIPGPGTYPLGVGATVVGGHVLLSTATSSWATPLSGADGTITITTLTADRIGGTFSVALDPFTGAAARPTVVTDGAFMLEVRPTGPVGALPDNAGSRVSATVNGAAWNAATVAGALTSGIVAVAASNNTRVVTMTLSGIIAPGTYALSGGNPVRSIGVSGVTAPLASTWSSLGPGGSGSVTITSLTPTRIRGTFTATLGPAPGTSTAGTLTIANGVFDVGLPPRP